MDCCSAGRVLTGPAGSATEVVPCAAHRAESPASVAAWCLVCPGQSPAWQMYVLGVVHLRVVPGAPPAVVNVPGATHEVLVYALDPRQGPRTLDPTTWRHLRPLNLVVQVTVPDDDAAAGLAAAAAQAVVDGILWAEPPLSGQVEPWLSALVKTAAHLRGEEHAP